MTPTTIAPETKKEAVALASCIANIHEREGKP
jgi:hypothetical protein